jgi:hypothetical protein
LYVIIGKTHKQKPNDIFPKDESEILDFHYVKIESYCTLGSFIMFPEGVRSLNSQNGGTTHLQWPPGPLWKKRWFTCVRYSVKSAVGDDNVPHKTCLYLIFKNGQKLVQLSFILIYSFA